MIANIDFHRDARLVHFKTERPLLDYRNQGRRPIETVMSFVSQEV